MIIYAHLQIYLNRLNVVKRDLEVRLFRGPTAKFARIEPNDVLGLTECSNDVVATLCIES